MHVLPAPSLALPDLDDERVGGLRSLPGSRLSSSTVTARWAVVEISSAGPIAFLGDLPRIRTPETRSVVPRKDISLETVSQEFRG
jgi:hypothetical protein